ncbi:MAG: T9SS type A sorting domain-containing protein, partial [Fluviicola sp.]
LGLEENITSLIEVSPNPVQTGSSVNVTIPSTDENLTIELVDINGSLISTINVSSNSGAQTVAVPMNVAQGIYFLNAIKGNEKTTRRVVVQ